MSLLSTIQRAAVLAGMPRPAAAANPPDSTTAQMVECARLDAEELSKRADWKALKFHQAFVTAAGYDQPGGLPADYGRMTFNGKIRQNNRLWSLDGPIADVDWEAMVDFPRAAYPSHWRIFGGNLQILPAPAAGEALRFDYITRNLYKAQNGTPKETWALDTDTCVLPENVIALGVIWRWRKLKGLDYGEDMITAEAEIARAMGQDGGGRPVLAPSRRSSAGRLGGELPFSGSLGPRNVILDGGSI